MPYFKLFYHAIWSTKNREPLIIDSIEGVITQAIDATCVEFDVPLLGIGFADDHIHVAFGGKPTLDLSKLIGRMKGSSSRAANASGSIDVHFAWQREYGVVSITERALPTVLEYLENQRSKHASNLVIQRMEREE